MREITNNYLVRDIKPPNHQSCFPQLFPRMFLILSSWKRKQSLLRLGATASWEPIPEYWADNLLLILYVGYNPFFFFFWKGGGSKGRGSKGKGSGGKTAIATSLIETGGNLGTSGLGLLG